MGGAFLLTLVALTSCSLIVDPQLGSAVDGGGTDAIADGDTDSSIPDPDADTCSDLAFANLCGLGEPVSLALQAGEDYLYDTDTLTLQDNDGDIPGLGHKQNQLTVGRTVLYVDTFVLPPGTTFGATGTNALAIVSTGPIDIQGTIELSELPVGYLPPGNNPPACTQQGPANGTDLADDGGGGGGGGHGGIGGKGAGTIEAIGGAARQTVVELAGGCSGGRGGIGTAAYTAAAGRGGGALYLASRVSVEVSGVINAGGYGGEGGSFHGGGGGGGAGGLVVLEAPSIWISGIVAANGGGAGGGSAEAGKEGQPGFPGGAGASRSLGGAGNGSADGGRGGALLAIDGEDGLSSASGGDGGGGGAAGVVVLISTTTDTAGGLVSPPWVAGL